MQVLIHGPVFQGVDGGAVVGGMGGGEMLEEGGEADADFERIHGGCVGSCLCEKCGGDNGAGASESSVWRKAQATGGESVHGTWESGMTICIETVYDNQMLRYTAKQQTRLHVRRTSLERELLLNRVYPFRTDHAAGAMIGAGCLQHLDISDCSCDSYHHNPPYLFRYPEQYGFLGRLQGSNIDRARLRYVYLM